MRAWRQDTDPLDSVYLQRIGYHRADIIDAVVAGEDLALFGVSSLSDAPCRSETLERRPEARWVVELGDDIPTWARHAGHL